MFSERQLVEQVKRLMALPWSGGAGQLDTRVAEFRRIFRGGLRDGAALSAVVDDLVEHCEECPAPADVVSAIRRYNTDTVESRRQRAADQERKDWPKLYGSPTAVLGDNCMCGKPWKEIFAEIRENDWRIVAQEREVRKRPGLSPNESTRAIAIRELGIVPHSVSCPATGSGSDQNG